MQEKKPQQRSPSYGHYGDEAHCITGILRGRGIFRDKWPTAGWHQICEKSVHKVVFKVFQNRWRSGRSKIVPQIPWSGRQVEGGDETGKVCVCHLEIINLLTYVRLFVRLSVAKN